MWYTTLPSMKKPHFRAIMTLLSNNDPRGKQIVASEAVIWIADSKKKNAITRELLTVIT